MCGIRGIVLQKKGKCLEIGNRMAALLAWISHENNKIKLISCSKEIVEAVLRGNDFLSKKCNINSSRNLLQMLFKIFIKKYKRIRSQKKTPLPAFWESIILIILKLLRRKIVLGY